ncbi:glycoside hydrolase family 125 protein [Mucilaginibacter robiniae]|uniref:Glycoside hydrolase family 125 protein n=2 Tax=Mucilaginibacter robiniae TaxID=2728022 RepID=A0A7L5EBK3_9SPHI|nr:glycoside hydrolase family 125 protein [Mucilaginibacter robiniae]
MMSVPVKAFTFDYYPNVPISKTDRRFESKVIEQAILQFQHKVKNKEPGWLFGNCFSTTLNTTVTFHNQGGRPDTYMITGDIDAMWFRDSSAQVWPCISFIPKDGRLKGLIASVINRKTAYILKYPYANAFYYDPAKVGKWAHDLTDMQAGIHGNKQA